MSKHFPAVHSVVIVCEEDTRLLFKLLFKFRNALKRTESRSSLACNQNISQRHPHKVGNRIFGIRGPSHRVLMPYFNIQVRGFEPTPPLHPPPPPPPISKPHYLRTIPQDREALFQVLSSLTDWVCRGLFALLVHAVMSCNCSMRRFSFHCFAIRADQNTCHHAQGTESCKHELNKMTCTLW